MLTIAELDQICQNSKGQLHKAIFPGLPPRRTLYISDRVRQLMTGTAPGMDLKMRSRWLGARALLENFVDGKWITVKLKPKSRAEMSILCPHEDGIWEFRDVRPRPSLRILGSFSQKDVYIALAPYERAELGAKESQEWANALQNYKAEWAALFDRHQPMSGGNYPNDYLSLAKCID